MKKSDAPTTYLLNYISTLGGTLESVYNLVATEGPLTLEACQERADFRQEEKQEDHVRAALRFLHTLGLLTREDEAYQATTAPVEGPAFRLQVVLALRRAEGDQAHFMSIYNHLVDEGHIGLNEDDLITVMNRKEFETPGEASLNAPKAAFWIRTSHYLGLIRQFNRSKRFLVMPAADLVLEVLAQTEAVRREISFMEWLRRMQKECFSMITKEGKLHPGFAAVVAELAASGQIKLSMKDDEQSFTLGPGVSATHVTLAKEEAANA